MNALFDMIIMGPMMNVVCDDIDLMGLLLPTCYAKHISLVQTFFCCNTDVN